MRKKTPKMTRREAKASIEALEDNCVQEGVWLAMCKCKGVSGFRRFSFGEPKSAEGIICPKCGNKEGIEWVLKRGMK